MSDDDFVFIPVDSDEWRMAGMGGFHPVDHDVIESEGGPGVYWYTGAQFDDFVLHVEWMATAKEDNSGIFLRFPVLGDWRDAVEHGFEVQIDDRGIGPDGTPYQPLHLTGAVYGLAPVRLVASRDLGEWNLFEIEMRGPRLSVTLNGEPVSRLDRDAGRPLRGHIGLQTHHPGSRVRFRNLCVKML